MNKNALRNISFYGLLFVITTIVINLIKQQAPFFEIPWTLLIIFIILSLREFPLIKPKMMAGIVFVSLLMFFRLSGGYVNWTSWVIYLILDVMLTALFYFCETHGWWQRHE